MDTYRCARARFCLTNKVQIHHIIPRQHKNYLRIIGRHEDEKVNLMFMPTKYGLNTMNIRKNRLLHDGGHIAYNKFVGKLLSKMFDKNDVLLIQAELRRLINKADPDLPWI